MEHYLPSLIFTYAACAAAAAWVLRRRYKRYCRAEAVRAKRAEEHEQEQFEIGQRIKRRMESERIMKEPVSAKGKGQTITVKGYFADMADVWKKALV